MIPRAIIDTNVWVSALLNPVGYLAAVVRHWNARRFTALISRVLFEELVDVLHRPRIRSRYPLTEAEGVIERPGETRVRHPSRARHGRR